MERPLPEFVAGVVTGVVVVVPDVVVEVLPVELLPLVELVPVPLVVVLVCAHAQAPTIRSARGAGRETRTVSFSTNPP